MFGPYFIEEIDDPNDHRKTLTSSRYIHFLKTELIPELRRRLTPEQFSTCWWQQDGASSHTAKNTIKFLKQNFGNRIISLNSDFVWPPHSPDLNPLDYWFWDLMKLILNRYEIETLDDFKLYIPLACAQITPADCKKAIGDFRIRIHACKVAKGAHFEPTLKSFKIARNKSLNLCDFCEQIHPCPCIECDANCMDNRFDLLMDPDNQPMDVDFDIDDCDDTDDSD